MLYAVTKIIDSSPGANGTFTNPIHSVYDKETFLNTSIYGAIWSGTVTLQRCFCNEEEVKWYDVQNWTENGQAVLEDKESGNKYRIGVKNGDYVSGSVEVRLSR